MKKAIISLAIALSIDCATAAWSSIPRNANLSFIFDGTSLSFPVQLHESDWTAGAQTISYQNEVITITTTHYTNITMRVSHLFYPWQWQGYIYINNGLAYQLRGGSSTTDNPFTVYAYRMSSYPESDFQNGLLSYDGHLNSKVINGTHGNITIKYPPNNVCTNIPCGVGAAFPAKEVFYSAVFDDTEEIELVQDGQVKWSGTGSYTIGMGLGKFLFRRKVKPQGAFPIIYANMADDAQGFPLFGEKDDVPLYANLKPSSLIADLWTEWQFNQSDYGMPKAYINDECVCEDHSTDHIISYPYDIIDAGYDEYNMKTLEVMKRFTMTITIVDSGKSGGSCNFRMWLYSDTYDGAKDGQRVQFSGDNTSVARFKLYFNVANGKYRLENDN